MTHASAAGPTVPAEVLEALLARVDLRALVAESVPVRTIDGLVRAPCPFHRDRAAGDALALVIDPAARRVECRACAFRASALGWLVYHDGLTEAEALHELGRRAGRSVTPWVPAARVAASGRARRERLAGIARAWRDDLARRPDAIAYLADRGISPEAASRYGLGWASADIASLGGDDERGRRALWQLGLLVRRGDGSFAPRFRDRLMLPVTDAEGRVIGFGGRTLDGRRPKYLASAASPLLDRSVTLYGLSQALDAPVAPHRLILVEGYLDVVSLAAHGVGGVVASLGTAVTEGQLRTAFAHAAHVTLCLDGDAAGGRAVRSALERALPLLRDGRRLDVAFLPPGEDPDAFVRARGADAVAALFADAVPAERALHAALVADVRPDSIGDLARLAATARPLVASIGGDEARARLVALLEGTLGLPWRPDIR